MVGRLAAALCAQAVVDAFAAENPAAAHAGSIPCALVRCASQGLGLCLCAIRRAEAPRRHAPLWVDHQILGPFAPDRKPAHDSTPATTKSR